MNDKVLLAQLKERQSAKGTRYLSGWLGKARVVGFLDREAPEGETVWQIYVQTPDDRGGNGAGGEQRQSRSGDAPRRRHDQRQPVPTGDLNDDVPW